MKALLFLILIPASIFGQVSFKSEWKSASAIFLAGTFDGSAELVKWHYQDFQSMFPEADPQFFDPHISWSNKYKNGDPMQGPKFIGSTTAFVGATDWYHMARTFRNSFMIVSITLAEKHSTWQQWLLRIAIHAVAYHAGFWVGYELPRRL